MKPNGRVYCNKHKQALIYLYFDGSYLCQVGEDAAIVKLHGLDKFGIEIRKMMIESIAKELR